MVLKVCMADEETRQMVPIEESEYKPLGLGAKPPTLPQVRSLFLRNISWLVETECLAMRHQRTM